MKAQFFVLSLLVAGCLPAYSQDPGTIAIQQANDQANLATQTALQMQQQQIQLANTINLQMQNTANLFDFPENTGPVIGSALKPTFSVKTGKVDPGTIVRLQTQTHYATIYYTTDGWSPTAASRRYTGPIAITAETHIQALAVGPNLLHSPIARADYWTSPPSKTPPVPPVPVPALVTDGLLRAGTPLHLATTIDVSSKTAEVGDKMPLHLDQDVKVGDTIVLPKGTPVDAILTVADPATKRGPAGDLVFCVQSISVQGKTIPLSGMQTLEGVSGVNDREAVIGPGMPVLATVNRDTSLKP